MYLHLGQGLVVSREAVIGVFDMDNTTSSFITREYLSRAEKEGRVITLGDELPNSFVVVQERDKEIIYLSQLSSGTLAKRGETPRIE